jgi:hypothetical protein
MPAPGVPTRSSCATQAAPTGTSRVSWDPTAWRARSERSWPRVCTSRSRSSEAGSPPIVVRRRSRSTPVGSGTPSWTGSFRCRPAGAGAPARRSAGASPSSAIVPWTFAWPKRRAARRGAGPRSGPCRAVRPSRTSSTFPPGAARRIAGSAPWTRPRRSFRSATGGACARFARRAGWAAPGCRPPSTCRCWRRSRSSTGWPPSSARATLRTCTRGRAPCSGSPRVRPGAASTSGGRRSPSAESPSRPPAPARCTAPGSASSRGTRPSKSA